MTPGRWHDRVVLHGGDRFRLTRWNFIRSQGDDPHQTQINVDEDAIVEAAMSDLDAEYEALVAEFSLVNA